MSRRFAPTGVSAFVAAMAVVSPPAFGGPGEAVERQIASGKVEQARARCDKLSVGASTEDARLKEACAEAFWEPVAADGSQRAWASYRERFAGTTAAARALASEGAAAVQELDARASEQQLILLANRYKATPSGEVLLKRAADAAVRDARSVGAALRVAERYPRHPGIPALVEAWPESFLQIDLDSGSPVVRVEPAVPLLDEWAPELSWVAREPAGAAQPWGAVARSLARSWGVPDTILRQYRSEDSRDGMPLCWVPGQPAGWGPHVEVAVGRGRVWESVGWDTGCGPDAWPVFVMRGASGVIGLSLRPGHLVDLTSIADDTGRRHTRGFQVPDGASPLLSGSLIYERTESGWLVSSVAGGVPWLTQKGPSSAVVPLDEKLRSAGLPEGWVIDRERDGYRVVPPTGARAQTALQNWTLPRGNVDVVPPLVATLLKLTPDMGRPSGRPAPPVGASGWKRTPGGNLLREPPDGARIAGLYSVSSSELQDMATTLAAVGFGSDWVTILDGWKADVDADGVPEVFLRAEMDDAGALLVVDPGDGTKSESGAPRVFAIDAPRVKADSRLADMPFAFRRGEATYLAWGGAEVLGATERLFFVEVVRSDGAGFVLEDVVLP